MNKEQITIEIRLFAGAAELAGKRQVKAHVPVGAALAEVVQVLITENPRLERLASLSRWAVGTEFVSDAYHFTDATSLAMIPPVSGG